MRNGPPEEDQSCPRRFIHPRGKDTEGGIIEGKWMLVLIPYSRYMYVAKWRNCISYIGLMHTYTTYTWNHLKIHRPICVQDAVYKSPWGNVPRWPLQGITWAARKERGKGVSCLSWELDPCAFFPCVSIWVPKGWCCRDIMSGGWARERKMPWFLVAVYSTYVSFRGYSWVSFYSEIPKMVTENMQYQKCINT